VRDFAEINNKGIIDRNAADEALTLFGIDAMGLDQLDHHILRAICENYQGGPVGIDTLAATIAEEAETIQEVYEPYLMQEGFLVRTARGRMTTPKAYSHLGLSLPKTLN
jgi:Holliday junction DNA helicase RuvB